ncbi:transmembrane protein 82-like [Polymixia lowei]
MVFPFSWILEAFEWAPLDSSPVDCFFQGLVGACGISVLCNLLRVHLFLQTYSKSETENERKRRSPSAGSSLGGQWRTTFQFWSLAVLLSLVGSRVSSLIVLEFSLRAVFAWITARADTSGRGPQLLLMQCQFSLGCALTCTLSFLQQGAVHSCFSLFLAMMLSWALAGICHGLWRHVEKLYPLHSTQRYCGKCITLLTSGHTILPFLERVVILAFAVAVVASTATVFDHFLSQKDALKFWTPLTLCYSMLLVYIQEEQHRQTGLEALLHSVVLRLGALMVLMLTMGQWSDVLHILITFLGEAVCLLPSHDLLQALLKEEEDIGLSQHEQDSRPTHKTRGSIPTILSDSTERQN